jgi:glutamate carboxypeptidase
MNTSPFATAPVLEAALTERLPQTLDFLQELVSINSFTANAQGVNENAQRIIQQFASLGFTSRLVPCAVPDAGNHLILDSGGDGPVVACIGHLDTVYSAEEEKRHDFVWQPVGERIYGPGIADIKGGTALLWMMLDALAAVDAALFRATRWILLWDAAEEVLARDFRAMCLEVLPPDTRACLVFEPEMKTGDEFKLVCARKGSGKFNIRVTGRAAHSGNSYAQGANAIHQIARVVDRVMSFTDLKRETTVNVGTIRGGTVNNRVPHEAEASLELRAFDVEHYEQVSTAILALAGAGDVVAAADGFPCYIDIALQNQIAPWPENERTQRLLALWQQAGQEHGLVVNGAPRGGLSDANGLWQHFPTLDALGPTGGNLHASQRSSDGTKLPEYLEPASLVPKALLNCLALHKLLAQDV